MKLLAHVHLAPPTHCAGAEEALFAVLTELRDAHGFDCRVIVARPPRRNDDYLGIPVRMERDPRRALHAYGWADIAVTHLDVTKQATAAAKRAGVPLVHYVHNDQQLAYHGVKPDTALVCFNSQWIADQVAWAGDWQVLHPPVWPDRYQLDDRTGQTAVALLNLAYAKGGAIFYELAARMPDVPFIGVGGAYAAQAPPPVLANLEILPHSRDVVAEVYARTAVLVMPSSYESWGRVAVEGALCGIPTVASPTPGLVETGIPAVFCPVEPHDLDEWEHAIRGLLRPEIREAAAEAAHVRAVELAALSRTEIAYLAETLRAMIP